MIFRDSFIVNDVDKCVYYKQYDDTYIVFCLYVDDILIFERDLNVIKKIKSFLYKNFNIKDMGEVIVIYEIKLNKNNNRITLTQSYYVEKLLEKFNYNNINPASTPYDPTIQM